MHKVHISFLLMFLVGQTWATIPQDDYHNYLIIMVHGLGGDSDIIGNTNGATAYPKHAGWLDSVDYLNTPVYQAVVGKPSKNTEAHEGGLFEFLTDTLGIDSANVRYYEMSRPCNGFYNDPLLPNEPTTSRELGDRNFDNPAAIRWPRAKSPGIQLRFGIEKDPVTRKGYSWLQQAMVDWEKTWRMRHPSYSAQLPPPDSIIPQKFILIGHSMGGLTIRSYMASKFYQNDVEKVVTVASPASGAEVASYIHEWGARGNRTLENDWNQQFIARTMAEGFLIFWAHKSGALDHVTTPVEQIMKNRQEVFQTLVMEHDFYGLCFDYQGVAKGQPCSIRDLPVSSYLNRLTDQNPLTWFVIKRLVKLGLKEGLDFVLQDQAGHHWGRELGVRQLEPLQKNTTRAISALNEFRFPDTSKYLPKFRASAIEDVPSPSYATDQEIQSQVFKEAWELFSEMFPQYASMFLVSAAANGLEHAISYGSDPWAFGTTQAVLNDQLPSLGYYLSQTGDFAVPTYSGQMWKNVQQNDRIEITKQLDFSYTRMPYDQVVDIGTSLEEASLATMAFGKLSDWGIINGWEELGLDVLVASGTAYELYSKSDDLIKWLHAHGRAMGYVGNRSEAHRNSIGQSIIETQLWDMPSVSITAIRKADGPTQSHDLIADTTIWAKRFSVGNRLGAWKEDVFQHFLTFRKRDNKGHRDYAFLPAVDLTTDPDTMRFVAEDFQVDSLKAILISVNYGPWKTVQLKGVGWDPTQSLNLDRTGYQNSFFMTKGDLDLKEGENDLRINLINRYSLGFEQHANIRLFTTSNPVQPVWPLDNVGITGGQTPVEFLTWPVYNSQTASITWHAVILGTNSNGQADSVVLPDNLFKADALPPDPVTNKPSGYRVHSVSDIDFSHFVVPGSIREALLRVTVTSFSSMGTPMPSYATNLHVVLDNTPPTVQWLNRHDTIKVSRAWIDSAPFVAAFRDNASQIQDVRVFAVSPLGQILAIDSATSVASGSQRSVLWNLQQNNQALSDGVYKLVLQARDPSYRNPSEYQAWQAYVDSQKPLNPSIYNPRHLNLGFDTLIVDVRNTAPVVVSVVPNKMSPRFDGTLDQAQLRLASSLAQPLQNVKLEYQFLRAQAAGTGGFDTLLRGGTTDSLGHDTLVLGWDGNGIAVSDGIWNLRVRGTDAWGNVGAYLPTTNTLTVDHTPPVLVVQGPDVHTVFANQTLQSQIAVREPNDRADLRSVPLLDVRVRLLDVSGTTIKTPTLTTQTTDSVLLASASLSLWGLGAGSYTFEVRATDRFGNTAVNSRSIVIDHLPTQITSPQNQAVVEGPFTLWGSADDPSANDHPFQNYAVECSVDHGVTWKGACASVPDGTSNVSRRTVDHGVLAWIVPPVGAQTLLVRLTSTDGLVQEQVQQEVVVTAGAVTAPFLVVPDTLTLAKALGDSLVRPVALPWGVQDLSGADSASLWQARLEWVDSTGAVRHRQTQDGIRFSSLFGAPATDPDSSGIYVFHERGAIYRLRVVTKSALDTVSFQVMGMGGVRPAAGAWRKGGDWTGVTALVDDGQNLFTFATQGRAGVWEMRLEMLGSQAFLVGQKLVFAGRKPWHAFADSQFVALGDSSNPAPVFAGSACMLIGTGVWDVGNAPAAWIFDAKPLVGAGFIPDGRYTVRLRVTNQSANALQAWGEFEKTVILRKTVPLILSAAVDPERFFPLSAPEMPTPRRAVWSVSLSQPAKLGGDRGRFDGAGGLEVGPRFNGWGGKVGLGVERPGRHRFGGGFGPTGVLLVAVASGDPSHRRGRQCPHRHRHPGWSGGVGF